MIFAEQVGLALQVVLETLSPPERIAFVLHDLFGLSFNQIAAILDRSPDVGESMLHAVRQPSPYRRRLSAQSRSTGQWA